MSVANVGGVLDRVTRHYHPRLASEGRPQLIRRNESHPFVNPELMQIMNKHVEPHLAAHLMLYGSEDQRDWPDQSNGLLRMNNGNVLQALLQLLLTARDNGRPEDPVLTIAISMLLNYQTTLLIRGAGINMGTHVDERMPLRDLELLLEALATRPHSVTELKVLAFGLAEEEDGRSHIARFLQTDTHITSVTFTCQNSSDNQDERIFPWVLALNEALRVNRTLTFLDLKFCQIDDDECVGLATALMENPHTAVREINLLENFRIGERGAKALAELLRVNRSIHTLNLFGNRRIGQPSLCEFADALRVNSTLRVLDLKTYSEDLEYDITDDVTPFAFADVLQNHNRSLKKIYLCGMNFTVRGVEALLQTLEVNPEIELMIVMPRGLPPALVAKLLANPRIDKKGSGLHVRPSLPPAS
jgi:hypothetical protein